MADRSKIEWTDATWNPILARRRDNGKLGFHCEKVSPACTHCYAASFNQRNLPARGTGLPYVEASLAEVEIIAEAKMLEIPLRWKRPRKVFVCSMTDLFAEFVPDALIDQVFAVMALCPQHTFQVLTKRPERMREYLSVDRSKPLAECVEARVGANAMQVATQLGEKVDDPWWDAFWAWPLPNVWLGVTAENQEWWDRRVPILIEIPAAEKFVSVEPMLGPIRGSREQWEWISQVIVGGESGREARPLHPDLPRGLRDQCQAHGVAFFFKQWGEWVPSLANAFSREAAAKIGKGATSFDWSDGLQSFHIGKKLAGRMLDGREWNEMPSMATV